MAKRSYQTNWPLRRDGKAYEAGARIELEEADAETLVEAGVLKPARTAGKPTKSEKT